MPGFNNGAGYFLYVGNRLRRPMMDRDKLYEDARNLYEKELRKLVDMGELTDKTLDQHYKLLDNIKDIDEICEKDMELDGAYEDDYSGMGSYPQWSNTSSYAGRRGRYGSMSSRNSAIDHIQTMVNNAKNDRERQMYQRWLDEAQRTL